MWGEVLLIKNENRLADEKFQQSINADQNYAITYYNYGISLMKQEKYNDAINNFNKIIEFDHPIKAQAFQMLGDAFRSLGDYKKAIMNYQLAIKENPNFSRAYFNWGLLLMEMGEPKEAIEKFKKVSKLGSPEWDQFFLVWGDALVHVGEYDEAIEKYQTAIEKNPRMTKPYYVIRVLFAEQGKEEKATKYFQKIFEIEPNSDLADQARAIIDTFKKNTKF